MSVVVHPDDTPDGTISAALRKAAAAKLKAPGDHMVLSAVYGLDGEKMTPRLIQPHLRIAMREKIQYHVKTVNDDLHVWRLA